MTSLLPLDGPAAATTDDPCVKTDLRLKSEIYRRVLECAGQANNGFSTPWVPDGEVVVLTFPNTEENLNLSVYWAKEKAIQTGLDAYKSDKIDLRKLDKEIAELQAELDEKRTGLESEKKELKTKKAELKGLQEDKELAALKLKERKDQLAADKLDPETKEKLESDITRLEGDVETLEDDIRSLESDVMGLESVVEKLASEIKPLEEVQTKKQEDRSGFQKNISQSLQNISVAFERATVYEQSDKDGVRTVKLQSRKLNYSYQRYQYLLVGTVQDGQQTKLHYVSLGSVVLSPRKLVVAVSLVIALICAILLFVGCKKCFRWFGSPNGRLSLSSVQIYLFSSVVILLSFYLFMRTGQLGDISEDVLLLIGIAGGSGAAAKVGDRFNQRLDWDNWLWLRELGWLPEKSDYRASDLVKDSAGNFDVFRFQALSFTILVGAYLLTAGLSGLSSIDLPDSIMGVLGLSQVTYIGGKVAMPPKFSDFNTQLHEFRDLLAKKGRTDSDVKDAGGKVARAFRAVFGGALHAVHPQDAGIRISFEEDTEPLFPMNIAVKNTAVDTLSSHQATYENRRLDPSADPVQIEVTSDAGKKASKIVPLPAGRITEIAFKDADF